jgi:hypothetical protein
MNLTETFQPIYCKSLYLHSENPEEMTAIELKRLLVHRIAEIDDELFLDAIKTILDSKIKTRTLTLTSLQKKEIFESKKEVDKGLFLEQVDLDNEFEKWLSTK